MILVLAPPLLAENPASHRPNYWWEGLYLPAIASRRGLMSHKRQTARRAVPASLLTVTESLVICSAITFSGTCYAELPGHFH